jgi:putative endonuclease
VAVAPRPADSAHSRQNHTATPPPARRTVDEMAAADRTHPAAAPHLERGRHAEALAEQFLACRGLVVIARNFRCRAGELDLVCRDGGVLAIIEVRARTRGEFGGALASVTARKRRKIVRATAVFLLTVRRFSALPVRFDVVALEGGAPAATLVWVKDAFRC